MESKLKETLHKKREVWGKQYAGSLIRNLWQKDKARWILLVLIYTFSFCFLAKFPNAFIVAKLHILLGGNVDVLGLIEYTMISTLPLSCISGIILARFQLKKYNLAVRPQTIIRYTILTCWVVLIVFQYISCPLH